MTAAQTHGAPDPGAMWSSAEERALASAAALRVLVPFDGSAHSRRAVEHLIGLARRTGASLEVSLLNVQPPIAGSRIKRDRGLLRCASWKRGGAVLAPARAMLQAAGIECADALVLHGPVARTIVRHAARTESDLIVMGTRGLGAVGNFFLGSVASAVLQHSRIPVMLTR